MSPLLAQFCVDAVLLSGLYALVSVGLALGFGTINILNFAHGEAIMLGAYGAYWAFTAWSVDPLVALLPLAALGFAAGYALFGLGGRILLRSGHMNQILLTFGVALVLQNLAAILWTGDIRSATPGYAYLSLPFGPGFLPAGRLLAFAIAGLAGLALWAWLFRTEIGRASRAIAENESAAVLMGIDVMRVYQVTFGISIGLAVVAGVVLSWIGSISPFMGLPVVVKAIAIMVLGGIGSIPGAILGAGVLGVVETAVAYFVPEGSGWAEAVAFLLLFLILVARPNGLFGRAVG